VPAGAAGLVSPPEDLILRTPASGKDAGVDSKDEVEGGKAMP
jgi:hypothetical protein